MNPMLWLELGSLFACLIAITMLARIEPALASRSGFRRLSVSHEDAEDEEETISTVSRTRERRIARWLIAWSLPCLSASVLSVHLGNNLAHALYWNPVAGEFLGAAIVSALILSICIICTQYPPREAARGVWLRAGLRSVRKVADLATHLGHAVLRPLGIIPPSSQMTEEEIKTLVELGEEEGVLPAGERQLIHSIFELGDTLVREIMIPRTDVVALPADNTLADALRLFETSGLSRIPIYEGMIDNIVGVLFVKDLFGPLSRGHVDAKVRGFARQPLFTPESKRADELFKEMRAKRMHIAIVVDEFGGTAGIATIEDILEEMVGEIVDEHDRQTYGPIRRIDDRTSVVDARAHVEDVMKWLSLTIPPGDYDTIGGFFLDRIERVPAVGDSIETDDAIYVVDQMRGRRIIRLRIIRKETESSA
jgi:CBS domain containing-hemolysin-like protein